MCEDCTRTARDIFVSMLTLAMIPPFEHDGSVRNLNDERSMIVRALEAMAFGDADDTPEHTTLSRAMQGEVELMPVDQLINLLMVAQEGGQLLSHLNRIFATALAQRAVAGEKAAQDRVGLPKALSLLAEANEYMEQQEQETARAKARSAQLN